MSAQIHGRADERAAVVARLGERRLVTLVGPGGIGKTALARVAATDVAGDFAMGAVEVDLTRVDGPAGVYEAIAGQLGYADFESLIDSPSEQPALVVVDNCEHVLDAAADAIARMLAACRMPTVLATSRVPLDLPDESIVAVGPLPTPDPDAVELDTPAMALLLERLRDQGIDDHEADHATLAEVCRRLDGVPLALELAAARLRIVSPADLLRELDEAPHALARRRFRGQSSHRSVAEVVGWSTDLLAQPVRDVFERLGIFAGPFTAEMASGVVVGDDLPPIREALADLVDASLVVADGSTVPTRYRLLHPVRAVAVETLRSSGRLDDTWHRFVDQVVADAVDVIGRASRRWDAAALPELMAHYDNIAASIRWAIDHDERPDRALTLVAVLWGLVHQAHTTDIAALGEAVLANWEIDDSPMWPDAVATVVTCRTLTQRFDEAVALAEQTLPIADRSAYAPATLRRALAQTHRILGDPERSVTLFADGAAVAESFGALGLAMELAVDVGLVEAELGRTGDALGTVDEVLERARSLGASVNEAWALAARAHVLFARGETGAVDAAKEAIVRSEAIDYPAGRSCGLRVLARASFACGDVAGAAAAADRLLDELLARGGLNDLRVAIDVIASIGRAVDHDEWRDLASTARALPITTVMVPVDPGLPDDGRVLSTRDAYVLARRIVRSVAARAGGVGGDVVSEDAGRLAATISDSGDVLTLTFAGRPATIRKSKGLADLHHLLTHPDRDVSCLDLMDAKVVASSSETETLDATARRQYEARLLDLQTDLHEAEDDHDLGRVERLQAEMDLLVDQLVAATGLGGRSRTSSAPAERARSAVTQRIRATIKRLHELHPALGRHLDDAVTTGQFCSYRPADGTVWSEVDPR